MYFCIKTYGHERGLSATFRQWRADSHCRFLHGYALSVELTFACEDAVRDKNGWVVDFGSLKPIEKWLKGMFDHKTLVAVDDPELNRFQELAGAELIQIKVVRRTGCEAFAEMIYDFVNAWLEENRPGVFLDCVRVCEHGANGAAYKGAH